MPRPKMPRPTDFELEILSILWNEGPSSVRAVHDKLLQTRPDIGRTTVSKIMEVMVRKELIQADAAQRPQVFSALIPETKTQRGLVLDLLSRVFGGSPAKMIMHALSSKKATPEELAKIRRMIDDADKK
jgi:predicted transcriptional regulator